jgi:hypothetical protein
MNNITEQQLRAFELRGLIIVQGKEIKVISKHDDNEIYNV